MLHNIVLFSAIYQHKSAIGIHMSPRSWISLSPPTPSHLSRLSQSPGLSSLSHSANSHCLSLLHMVMCIFICYSLHSSDLLPPAPPLCHPPHPTLAKSIRDSLGLEVYWGHIILKIFFFFFLVKVEVCKFDLWTSVFMRKSWE